MKTAIKNLCGKLCNKLRDWGIDPITLIKSIGVFIALIILAQFGNNILQNKLQNKPIYGGRKKLIQ